MAPVPARSVRATLPRLCHAHARVAGTTCSGEKPTGHSPTDLVDHVILRSAKIQRSGLSDFAARKAQASTNGARPLAPSNLTTGAAVSFSPYVRKKRSRVFWSSTTSPFLSGVITKASMMPGRCRVQ